MSNLVLAMRSRGEEGTPLPTVIEGLGELQAHLRKGQLSLWAAAGGVGKSAVMSHISVNADWTGFGDKISVLYFSADSDRMTFGSRVAAGVTQSSIGGVEERIKAKDPELWEQVHEATQHVWLNWQSAPTLRDITEELDAFAGVHGRYPDLIVVDNLMNVSEGGQDADSHDAILDYLQQIGRETSGHVAVLCHLVGAYTNGNVMPPREAIMNKLDKRPRLIITLWKPGENMLALSVVKNSVGRADPTGRLCVFIPWIPERSWFGPSQVVDLNQEEKEYY